MNFNPIIEDDPVMPPSIKRAWEMTLRDWFAGQALAGLLADHEVDLSDKGYAAFSFGLADAMLAERAKGQEAGQ